MRIDPEHTRKLARAFGRNTDGTRFVKLDLPFLASVLGRLTLWERGLLNDRITKAAAARRRSLEQRLLLALFAHTEADTDTTKRTDEKTTTEVRHA